MAATGMEGGFYLSRPGLSTRAGAKIGPDRDAGLPGAVVALDEREPDVALASGAEPDARGDGDPRVLQKLRGERHRTSRGGGDRPRRPDEHRRDRQGDRPTGSGELATKQRCAMFVKRAVARDIRIAHGRQRGCGRELHRAEDSVVEVALDGGERADQRAVTDAEADPPPGHRIALRDREELHG